MDKLNLFFNDGQFLVDSREVAEMTEKEHPHLMRDIRGYKAVLDANPILDSANFFIESAYTDSQNQVRPKYDLTRKGCDMVANKMTGEKGILFTAVYVTQFDEMEQRLKPSTIEDLIIMQAQSMKDMKAKVIQLEEKVNVSNETVATIKETLLHHDKAWRKSIIDMINAAVARTKGDHREIRSDSYKRLEERAGARLNIQLTNLKKRLEDSGATKSKIEEASKLDIIEADKRLKEIYTIIVKELSIGTL